MRASAVRQGTLPTGMPYLCVGSGRPLLFLPGVTAHHRQPDGWDRRFQLQQIRTLAKSRRVWWINRRPELRPPVTMADLARDYADALLSLRLTEPIDVAGVSTGGSVALELAADHPATVRRLAVVSAAYRLGSSGRDAQRRTADRLRGGRVRQAAATMTAMLGTRPFTRRVLSWLGWVLGPAVVGRADPDLIATLLAEDAFDIEDRLAEIIAPTLVVGGDRDAFYGRDLFARTAALIPCGQLELYPGKGHLSTHRPDVAGTVLAFLRD